MKDLRFSRRWLWRASAFLTPNGPQETTVLQDSVTISCPDTWFCTAVNIDMVKQNWCEWPGGPFRDLFKWCRYIRFARNRILCVNPVRWTHKHKLTTAQSWNRWRLLQNVNFNDLFSTVMQWREESAISFRVQVFCFRISVKFSSFFLVCYL
jgi:hypothetical protein